MQGTEFIVKATVCFAIGGVNISTINSYPASVRMNVLVCGRSTVILILFEGGLLCLEN